MAQNNKGRPGMPPSPNQKLVLDELALMSRELDDNSAGYRIDTIAHELVVKQIGGHTPLPGTIADKKYGRVWQPWTNSTVRDHLNALVHRGHAQKKIISGVAYFRV